MGEIRTNRPLIQSQVCYPLRHKWSQLTVLKYPNLYEIKTVFDERNQKPIFFKSQPLLGVIYCVGL